MHYISTRIGWSLSEQGREANSHTHGKQVVNEQSKIMDVSNFASSEWKNQQIQHPAMKGQMQEKQSNPRTIESNDVAPPADEVEK